jgi:hypothetical protein
MTLSRPPRVSSAWSSPRSASLWLLIRVVIAPFAMATGEHPVFLSPSAALIVFAVCVSLCWIETRRKFEGQMLANLGTSPLAIAFFVVVPPAVLEYAVALAGAWA